MYAVHIETAGWCGGMRSVMGLNRTPGVKLERRKVPIKLSSRAAYLLSNIGDGVSRGLETSRVGGGEIVIAVVMLVVMTGLLRNMDPVSATVGVLIFIDRIRQVFFDTIV
ncbi:hypothetical protein CGMCC3_g7816 [Colletotrichum fructicola]|nr:uncharacterized protein CGMCC3_g7816 [Colletotrichum fructicola]KAE9576010.1 hypothetical protein CGMCC3_g7816 [Colletotrichum fructicola]